MAKAAEALLPWPICSLLLFVATSAEEDALQKEAARLGLDFRKDAVLTKHFRDRGLRDEAWTLGTIGGEMVVAVGSSRIKGNPVMGPHGRLGSAAKGLRYLAATGAQGIIQVGMAFGIARGPQKLGDVLVSTSLIPYDKRDVKPSSNKMQQWGEALAARGAGRGVLIGGCIGLVGGAVGKMGRALSAKPGYFNDYSALEPEPARSALVERCLREKERTKFDFTVHVGAMLSGAARIHCARFRDELYRTVPHGNEPIVGGEMEGVGLLAAAAKADDPVWCVVKGIGDFADEQRDEEIKAGLVDAPRNAAYFVLSSLVNDAKMLAEQEEP
jgi:nucleoside phosphorylase